ncbi:MAG: DNA repair protein RecO [Rhodothermia bacterium]|nr:MAG: DNA repair protein RecO [Rhodothermia bacterium]
MLSKPAIIKTEAIVLRALDYGETSRIVTLYTAEMGKLSVLAKGARSSKNRFGSTLDPLTHIQAIIYIKPSRELQSITDASHSQTFRTIRDELSRIEVGLKVIELTNAIMHDSEQNRNVFLLLTRVLTCLDLVAERYQNLFPYYQLSLASECGFAPVFDRERVADLTDRGGTLDLESGEIRKGAPASGSEQRASRSALRAFAILARAPIEKVTQMSLRPETMQEVGDLICAYMKTHFGDIVPDRASRVFAQLEIG